MYREGTSLRIIDVVKQNVGYYECMGRLDNGTAFYSVGQIKFSIRKFASTSLNFCMD